MPESRSSFAPGNVLGVPAAEAAEATAASPLVAWRLRGSELIDRFLFEECLKDPELARRARLISRFGILGFIFGLLYAGFYFFIGHYWGVRIIVVCSVAFLATPFLMKSVRSVQLGGNLLTGIMAAGFTALCWVEGGMEGHALAWLVTIPLCALLLTGKEAAGVWTVIVFFAGAAIVGTALAGISLPPAYDKAWHPIVSAAGYLGLIIFMFMLGMIFETGRERAFRKMRQALEELAASNEKLVHLNNEKNEFLGIAAHDLKNPVTTIIGYAELLQMMGDPAQNSRLASNIISAGSRMRDLIKDLLDANAIEEGRFASKLECCELADLIAQCVEHNQSGATRKTIAITVAAEGPLAIRADRSASIQILDNLVSNAIKFSPPGSTVQITARKEFGFGRVSVTDQGPGISEEDQKKLFRKFTRLSARPTAGESSNGLGLSIVKRLAESMSGNISCTSALGQGATFTLRLPQWEERKPGA
jgi:signal transduction histidine kinase